MTVANSTVQCMCGHGPYEVAFTYNSPPAGEVQFDLGGDVYRRELHRCIACGHFVSVHDMDMSALYAGEYVDATYGPDGLRRTFERIVALPEGASDNKGRVTRLLEFVEHHSPSTPAHRRLLDVGSGLGVFPYEMKRAGWHCTALDPDPRSAKHCRETAGVEAIEGDFMYLDLSQAGPFDVVTFNKVLEHVIDPVAMLARGIKILAEGGVVYVELPDGEVAADDGPEREEFFIDHHHVFSFASTALLAQRAGFRALEIERLQEPSTKYTLRAFLTPVT